MTSTTRYRVLRPIRAGDSAEVFEALLLGEDGFERRVALKKCFAESAEERARFIDEARIAALLHHPNLVAAIDYGSIDGVPFLVSELVDGQDLQSARERCALPLALALHVGAELARGVHAAHTAVDRSGRSIELVHRDVTPANVLLSFDGEVKLADFGIARFRHPSGEPVDLDAHIFSLGCVLHFAITGKSPQMPLCASLDNDVRVLLERALRITRTERWDNAEEMARDLESLAHRHLDGDPKLLLARWMQPLRGAPPTSPNTNLFDLPALITGTEPPSSVLRFFTRGVEPSSRAELSLGQRIGAYRSVRELGRGGMGTVYLGVRADDQYQAEVAIKVVNRGMDSDAIHRRFLAERQILADLDHPNIARMLDGGSTSDGLPYLVMEYIEGRPITEYCEAQQLCLAKRIELFREVCSAVQYAHQNLVVHRDIKPSNTLVTVEGQPKLLDFGIAKLLTTERGEHTADTTPLMTPEYASPEQYRGAAITTSSDIYSLGVILYELISGKHPYELTNRDRDSLARAILEEEPRQRLSGDVGDIVHKALRKEPERRYASVQELSEDLRAYLEGRPVAATPDRFGYRARKFVRRNTAAVFTATVAIVSLLGATVMTAWQAHVAGEERSKAERRFEDVRALANAVVFELHDAIQNLPGSTPARELLVRRALEYLDGLAQESGEDRALLLELSAAYDKIGDIQGGFGTSNLGARKKARESYEKSLAIRNKLHELAPNDVDARRMLAVSLTKLGDISWIEVDIQRALKYYGRALEIDRELATQHSADPKIRLRLAVSLRNYGYMLGASDRRVESIEHSRQGVELIESLAAADPKDEKLQWELALSYDKLAELLTGLGPPVQDHARALELMKKAQRIGDALLAADPQNARLRRGQAVSYFNVASVSAQLQDLDTGLDSSRAALAIMNALVREDPENEDLRQGAAHMQTFVCEMMIKKGLAKEAIELLEESFATLEKSYAASPSDQIAHYRLALNAHALGRAHLAIASDKKGSTLQRREHGRKAREYLEQGLKIYGVFNDAGKLTGEDVLVMEAAARELTECNAALAELNHDKADL